MPKQNWKRGDPASIMVGGKRYPVSVLGLVPGEDEEGEPKVQIRLVDGSLREVHPNGLIRPGQTTQYRQRLARVEKGGVAGEANRLAAEGWRLITVIDTVDRETRSYDHVKMAVMLFGRDVPAEIEKVELPPMPEPHAETPEGSEDDAPHEEELTGDEPEDRDASGA